jgi:single-strand DNA-binding protein
MNEITIHGNVAGTPEIHRRREDRPVAVFTVGVNERWFNRAQNRWESKPTVWHKVVAFGQLAENAGETLSKGMTVTVTGQLADDSYTPDGWDKPLRRIKLEASDIAVSLRWATATVTKRTREQEPAAAAQQPAQAA